MRLNAYALFDVKADVYNAPFFVGTHGQAMRAFADLAADENTTVHRHPEDYKLVHVGVFDDASGLLDAVVPPVSLGFATEFVKVARIVKDVDRKVS